MSPQRIQLRRTKGWRKPEGAVVVSRPSQWGNPFRVQYCGCCGHYDVVDDNGVNYLIDHRAARKMPPPLVMRSKREATRKAVELFAGLYDDRFSERDPQEVRDELRGKDLACWCPLDQPCHADVLLEIANSEPQP